MPAADDSGSLRRREGAAGDSFRPIVEEGHYPDGLMVLRSGFARVSQRFGDGHRTLRYLGKGQLFGFEELVHNWRHGERIPYRYSLRAIGYVDVLLVPTRLLEEVVLPSLPDGMLPGEIEETELRLVDSESEGRTESLEQLVEQRFINGTRTMVIDLERCTHCDDCVRACAAAHQNNPKFTRHGSQIGRFLISNACMHCVDPVCMIGCPTGAISRGVFEGLVLINDRTCIGCATCANNCPYDNILMVEARDADGAVMLDANRAPILKATKCDLCHDQRVSPACQQACPHGALRRVDMREPDIIDELLRD